MYEEAWRIGLPPQLIDLYNQLDNHAAGFTTTHHSDWIAAELGRFAPLFGYSYLTGIRCGKLHDLGKLLIPADILLKPGLTEEVRALFRRHPQDGYQMTQSVIQESGNFEDADIIGKVQLGHHFRTGSSSYPFKTRLPYGRISCDGVVFSHKELAFVYAAAVLDGLQAGPALNRLGFCSSQPAEEVIYGIQKKVKSGFYTKNRHIISMILWGFPDWAKSRLEALKREEEIFLTSKSVGQ